MGLFSKPEVVIAKESSNAKEYLRQLEELAEKAAGENAKKIAKEIAVVKAGIIGEDNILFELKNSGMDMVVLHDLYIESVSGASAQIDFLVLTPKINFVLECKNLFGNIEINSKGDFIRTIRCGGRYYKEGIYSPITQNQRHLQVLKERRSENDGKILAAWKNYLFKDFFRGLVVLANPKTVVNDRYAKKEVKEQVIRADQLIETIKRMNKASKESASSLKDLKEMGERYLQMHIEKPITYIENSSRRSWRTSLPPSGLHLSSRLSRNCLRKTAVRSAASRLSCGRPDAVRMSAKNSGAAQDFLNVIL